MPFHRESFALATETCILSLLFGHLQNYLVESESENVSHSSHVQLFATPWTAARQTPLPMGFPRQEYWGGLPFPSPGDLPNPGIKPASPALQADSLPTELPGKLHYVTQYINI